MAKRFTDTGIWDEDWFLDLGTEEKLFWFYLKDACDHAGLWRVNRKRFDYIVGKKFKLEEFLQSANSDKTRIIVFGDRWYVTSFIKFQYGQFLNPANRVHESIIKQLSLYVSDSKDLEVILTSFRPQIEVKVGVKDKDKDKDKEKNVLGKEGLGENPKPEPPKTPKEPVTIHPFQKWIKENCPRVSKLPKQLTFDEAKKLVEEYDKELLKEKMLSMENKKKLDYVSVHLTLRNWLKKEELSGNTIGTSQTKNPRSRP